MKKKLVILCIVIFASLVIGMVTAAPVTQSINYQGKLTDTAGNPLTGTYSVTFNLYEVSAGGTAIATDTHTIQVLQGLFTTQIAADSKFFDGRALWIGIKVGADAEMTPRQELHPVPYALSLRPEAWIRSANGSPALNIINIDLERENACIGLNVSTAGWSGSDGVVVSTLGSRSYAVRASTLGFGAVGMSVTTNGPESDGIRSHTSGELSFGVVSTTTGFNSRGIYTQTSGDHSYGVDVDTFGNVSTGVVVSTSGEGSTGLISSTSGINSVGINTTSDKSYGLFAHTARPDQMYGIYTPDYLYAKGTQVPSSDIAEYMPVSDNVEPGTVLIIGEDGKLQISTTAYDTKVAGIVSTSPGVTLGIKEGGNNGEQIIAVAGRVPCKVDATHVPIHAGDLLTTSENPGYAMKATNPQIGTILGKAMGILNNGTGTIEVLVTLQ